MNFKRQRPKINTPRQPSNRSADRRSAYSYYKSGVEPKPIKKAEKTIDLSNVGRRLRLLPAIIAVIVIAGSVLISLTLSSSVNIETLQDQTSPYRPLDDYAETAAEIIDKNLANKTKFTVQTDVIEAKLIEEYPELKAAALRLPVLGRKPTLVLDIRQPALLLTTSSAGYVLDNRGVVVSEVRNLSAESRNNLPVVRDQSGLDIKVGKQAVTTDTIEFIEGVLAQFSAKEMKLEQLVLPASANELDITVEGLKYFVKTDTSGDPRLQVGSFLAVKNNLERQGIRPSEYIDVRVEEKVFYK